MLSGHAVNQAEEEGRGEEEESEGEEEAIELEKEPEEVEEEGWEKREEDDEQVEVKEAKERVEEAEEAIEEERDDAEEMTEMFPDAADEEVKIATPLQEADEGVDVVVGDVAVYAPQHTNDDETPTELGDQVFAVVHESQADCKEREDGEERVKRGVDIDRTEQKSGQEEEGEANQPDADQTEKDVEQEGVEIPHLDTKQDEKDQTEATEQAHVSPKPSSLSLPESHYETQPPESGAESGTSTPSKTSTTTLHINLLSPSSEKATSFFQQSPTAAYPKESDTAAATEQNTASTEEEAADSMETVVEEKQPALEEEATPAASAEETVNQPPSGSDQSKVRFTIAPAWQRSLSVEDAKESLTPPSSPPACVSSSLSAATGPGGVEVEATSEKDPEVKAEPASSPKVELVLSPGRVRNAGTTAKPQTTPPPSHVKPQTSAAASTEGKNLKHVQR